MTTVNAYDFSAISLAAGEAASAACDLMRRRAEAARDTEAWREARAEVERENPNDPLEAACMAADHKVGVEWPDRQTQQYFERMALAHLLGRYAEAYLDIWCALRPVDDWQACARRLAAEVGDSLPVPRASALVD